MYKNENKICPRCNTLFDCKAGDITNCQCYTVRLNNAERDHFSRSYADCLCANCIQAVRLAYNHAQQEIQLKKAFGLR